MSEQPENLSGVRVHPPLLTLVHLLAAFFLGWLLPLPLPSPGLVALAGWVIVAFALGLAFWAVSRFRGAQTTLNPHGGTTAIVMSGPYRFTRNPIYVGYVCLLIGFPLVLDSPWGLLLAPVLMLFMDRLVIEYEEAYLAQQFGQEYLDFKSRVHRWI